MAQPSPPRTEHRHPLIAGGLAGAAEILCTYPLEYIKTQLQIAGPWARAAAAAGARPLPAFAPPPLGLPSFSGSADVVRQTLARHGALGLYRGLAPNFYFSFPKVAIRFWAFEEAVAAMRGGADGPPPASSTTPASSGPPRPAPLTPAQSFTAGLVSGVVEALVVIIPMTTMQVKFVADLNRPMPVYRGFLHGVRTIVAEEGPGGLYRGAGPTLLKIALNMSFRFLLYNEICAALEKKWAEGEAAASSAAAAWRSTAISLAAGAIAGAVTVVGNHPVDVVKSNMQAQQGRPGAAGVLYRSAVHCAQTVYAAQGIRGLYAGLVPRLNRVVLETSLSFTFFEHLSRAANVWVDGRP